MGEARPEISIVVPCFGRHELLAECLASIRSQTHEGWECVIVDDGHAGADALERLVSSIHDNRIVVLRHARNRGMGAARNTGIRNATAPKVVAVDTDDQLAPTFLEATLDAFASHPAADCVFTDFELYGDSTGVQHWTPRTMAELAVEQRLPGPGTVMRRTLWERVGGYGEDLDLHGDDDWDFWIGAAELGFVAVHRPEPLYRYRDWGGSYTATELNALTHQTRDRIYKRHRAFFDRQRMGRSFRAGGYLASSLEELSRGARLRAARLALRGWLIDPTDRRLARIAAGAIMPDGMRDLMKRLSRAA